MNQKLTEKIKEAMTPTNLGLVALTATFPVLGGFGYGLKKTIENPIFYESQLLGATVTGVLIQYGLCSLYEKTINHDNMLSIEGAIMNPYLLEYISSLI